MKRKITLGESIKEAREALNLTQRQLAAAVKVKASHIAYLETNQRRASLPLLRRLAAVLGLEQRELLFLCYPDAKEMVNGTTKPRRAWEEFASNRAALKRHKVTDDELKVLKQVSMLRDIASPKHFLFILNSIRQAGE